MFTSTGTKRFSWLNSDNIKKQPHLVMGTGFQTCTGFQVQVWVWILIPTSFKTSQKMSKMVKNWLRYDEHKTCIVCIISYSNLGSFGCFWTPNDQKTHGITGTAHY